MTTYTHVGGRARVGYQQRGRDWNHYEPRAGKAHALNRSGYRCFVAVCGVTVREDSSDQFDQGGANPIEVAVGSDRRVTCKQCLARRPAAVERPTRTEWAVVVEQDGAAGVYFATDHRPQAEAVAAKVATHGDTFGRPVQAVRIEQRTRYVG